MMMAVTGQIMLVHCGHGCVFQGILLSLKGDEMRVAVKDADDVAEIRLVDGQWIAEGFGPVTFEFPLAVFQALGMVPDGQNVDPEPDLFWRRDSIDDPSVDPLN
ncbi:MAG: hypothetical protein LAQ69_00790 [Acidobacteriia bacterium]|nr:hypothetical protein [Terriglobia bacterium]